MKRKSYVLALFFAALLGRAASADPESEFLVDAGSSGPQTIQCNDYTKLLFQQKNSSDPNHIYDATNSVIQPPTGIWQIQASVLNVTGPKKDGILGLVLFKNGKVFRYAAAQQGAATPNATNGMGASLNFNVVSAGSDKFEIYAYYGSCSANAQTVESQPAGSSTWLQVTRLSGPASSAPSSDAAPTSSVSNAAPLAACPSSAQGQRGQNGKSFTCFCDPNNHTAAAAWGTDFYTDDSSICLSAAHAGAVKDGGVVTYVIAPGQASYVGSLRNGIQTFSYGSWIGSVTFVK